LLDLDLLEAIQIAQDLGPFDVEAGCGETVAELLLEHESEERAEHVAADGRVALVEDRPGSEQRFGAPEQLLDALQFAIAQHRLERIEAGVGSENEDAVEARVLGDPRLVDRETHLGRLEEPPVAAVADQRLVAGLERLAQAGHDRLPVGGVLLRLGPVAADDVAAAIEGHRLGFQFGIRPSLPRDHERDEGRLVAQHQGADFLCAPLTNPEHVFEATRLEGGQRLGADHAAIGHHAHPSDPEPPAQAVDHRDQRRDVGGVARPHLAAERPAALIHHHRNDHLHQVGPVVLGVPTLAEALAARAFEVEAGGVHEDDRQLAEQVAAGLEQPLLHHILEAARGERGAVRLLGVRQLLAEPAHRAVEVVEGELVGALDPIVLAPGVGGTVRARDHQPVEHGQEAGALEREAEAALGGQILDHRPAAGLLPEPFEGERRADPVGGQRRCAALIEQREDHRALCHARGRAGQAIEVAVRLDVLLAAEVLDDPLLGTTPFAHALDQVEVPVGADLLFTHVHAVKQHTKRIKSQSKSKFPRNYLAAHALVAANRVSAKSITWRLKPPEIARPLSKIGLT